MISVTTFVRIFWFTDLGCFEKMDESCIFTVISENRIVEPSLIEYPQDGPILIDYK